MKWTKRFRNEPYVMPEVYRVPQGDPETLFGIEPQSLDDFIDENEDDDILDAEFYRKDVPQLTDGI